MCWFQTSTTLWIDSSAKVFPPGLARNKKWPSKSNALKDVVVLPRITVALLSSLLRDPTSRFDNGKVTATVCKNLV